MNVHKGADKFAQALLRPINPAAIIILGVYTVFWGIWIINPWTSIFPTVKLFSVLIHVAPEWFWGANAIICGSITTYGAITGRYRPLLCGASVATWHWFIIAIFYFLGDWTNPDALSAVTFTIYSVFVRVNIKVNFSPSLLRGRRHCK